MEPKLIKDVPFIYLSKYELLWDFMFLSSPETIYQVFMRIQEKWEVSYLKDYPNNFKRDDPKINISKRIVSWVMDKADKRIKIAVMPNCIADQISINDNYYRIVRMGEGLNTRYAVERKKQYKLTEEEQQHFEECKQRVPSLIDAIVAENKIPITNDDFKKVQHRCELLELD